MYLPREDYCTLHFLQQILGGDKQVLRSDQVAQKLNVPNWPELSVRKVWPMAIRFPLFKTRTPDEWYGNLRTDRQFFWTILFSVSDSFVIRLVDNCREQRIARLKAKK